MRIAQKSLGRWHCHPARGSFRELHQQEAGIGLPWSNPEKASLNASYTHRRHPNQRFMGELSAAQREPSGWSIDAMTERGGAPRRRQDLLIEKREGHPVANRRTLGGTERGTPHNRQPHRHRKAPSGPFRHIKASASSDFLSTQPMLRLGWARYHQGSTKSSHSTERLDLLSCSCVGGSLGPVICKGGWGARKSGTPGLFHPHRAIAGLPGTPLQVAQSRVASAAGDRFRGDTRVSRVPYRFRQAPLGNPHFVDH